MDTEEPNQKDVDAIISFLTKEEEAPVELDKELTKLIEWVVSEKDRYLVKLTSSPEEIVIFNTELSRINSIRHKLRLMDEVISDVSLKADIWEAVVTAFIAGINLGQYSEPINPVKEELKSRQGAELSKKAAVKKAPKIATRKRLLENFCISKGLSLEELARSRNLCSTIAMDDKFISLCEAEGVKAVKEKRIQEYAADILKERHKK
jgi:hypothetical protein